MRTPVKEMTPVEAASFAKEIIVRKLSERAHSRFDLAQALAKKHVPCEIAEAMLDKFEQAGLVDDEEFARSWVRSRSRSKGLARTVLAMELRRKGIDDEIVRSVLADLDPDSERQAAHRLVQKKLRSMGDLEEPVRIRRLVAMLARKGYAPQVAYEVVREELDGERQPLESL